MKKFIVFFLVLLCVFLMTACQNPQPKNFGEVSDEDQPTSADSAAKANDTSTKAGSDITGFIPAGWHVLEVYEGEPAMVKGDLNKDGIEDIAAVIEAESSAEGEAPERAVGIFFGGKDNTYTLSVMAENAVLRKDEGGVFGDPFESIAIDRGSIVISFYGGSNWRWYSRYRFRYQEDDWYLIGATQGSYFNATTTKEDADETDFNLLTGDYIERKIDEKGKQIITKGNRGRKPLVKLRDFAADSAENQF